ncbi:MAG: alpha/beta hydrolase [Solirubrobacterales bacterium]
MKELDLGPCRALLHEGDRDRCLVLLPGARYPTRAPLLWFARAAGAERGWSALEVLDLLPAGGQPGDWALDRTERALAAAPGADPVVVGKSLASAAAGLVADRGLAAVWLTPLLGEAAVIGGLAQASRPTLLVGGTADGSWRPDASPQNPALETEEIEGADHSLELPGDVSGSLDALRTVTARIGAFLEGL